MTVQELTNVLILIASLITAGTVICVFIKKVIDKALQPIQDKIDIVDANQCRNYIVDYLADVDKGIEKDDCQTRRAYECYEHYTKDLGKNSYIHDKWQRLMERRDVS